MSKITYTNGFRAMKTLQKVAQDERIDEIEGHGMDDGRVFIHLTSGYMFSGYDCGSMSVGNVEEIKYAMSLIVERKSA